MHHFRNRRITNEIVTLDYAEFESSQLIECQIQYGGGEFAMTKSSVFGCTFQFVGAAKRTIDLLKHLGILQSDPQNWRVLPPADEQDC
jgi:hypothetical protein